MLGSNFALYHTTFGASILPDKSNAVVIGSLIDLAIVAPLLFLAWKRKWSWKNVIVSMAAGLIFVRFLIPMEYLSPFEMVTWVGFAIEGMLIFHYAFASWRKKLQFRENEFTLHQKSSFIALRIMLIHALVLETTAIHWMLHDKHFVLVMIVFVLDIYTVIFFIADTQAVRINPLKVAADRLFISFGLMKRVEVKWSDIEEKIDNPKELQQKCSKDTLEFVARDFEETYPTIILKLKHPVEAR